MRALRIALVVLLGLGLRLAWPLADPPPRLSWSTGIYTDPASKTLPARYAVELGDWHRAEGAYLRAFPLANGLTWAAYRLFGTGRLSQQTMMVGVAVAGLLALFAALRRGSGSPAATLGVLLAACSYWLVFFARVPVVENLVASLLILAALLGLSPTGRSRTAAGVVAAVAALYGKYHAIGFLPALALFVVLRDRKWRAAGAVLGGAAAVALVWLFTTFLPHREEILAYVRRVSTGVHGPLPLMRSPVEGLLEVFRSVRAAWLFHHAPVLGGVGLLFAVRTVTSADLLRRRLRSGSALFAFAFLAMWVYYALLAYKAPRYYVAAGLLLAGCAAAQLAEWMAAARVTLPRPRGWREHASLAVTAYALGLVAVEVLRQLLSVAMQAERVRVPDAASALFRAMSVVADRVETGTQETVGALAIAAGILVAAHLRRREGSGIPGRRLAVSAVAVALAIDLFRFGVWATHRKYVIEEAKAALPALIGRDSVVLGPFAALLTQDSGIFALSLLDPLEDRDVLAEEGVTHVVLDERSEESGFALRVPGLESRTQVVAGWPLRSRYVRNVRIARVDTAPNAPTPFERAVEAMAGERWSEALEIFAGIRAGRAATAEIREQEASCWMALGDPARAREALQESLRLRPDDPGVLQNLGVLAYRAGDPAAAREAWVRALRLEPHNTDLLALIRTYGKGR